MKMLFLGGCLLTTKTVEKEKRFINVLLSRNPQLDITLVRYASFSLIEEILLEQTTTFMPDVVIFLVRPFPFYTLTKLFPRVPSMKGGVEIKFHPRIFSCKEWFIENDRLIVEMDWNPNGTKRTLTHSINLLLGEILNLDEWALEYVKGKLLILNEHCRIKNIPLIIVGSPEVRNDKTERKLIEKLNNTLIAASSENRITFVNLFSRDFPEGMLGPDKVHYNEAGHFQLAKKIEEAVLKIPVSAKTM